MMIPLSDSQLLRGLYNASSAAALPTEHSSAYEASKVLKASAGTLLFLYGHNSGPDQFLQLHDSATLPAENAAPIAIFKVEAGKNFSLAYPQAFANGIVVCNSSTGPTKTLGSADCFFTAVVK